MAMGKKRKTRKQKLLSRQRKKQLESPQVKPSVPDDQMSTIIKSEKNEPRIDSSIYAYPVNLIKRDLVKSLGLALIATLILGLFYYFLP